MHLGSTRLLTQGVNTWIQERSCCALELHFGFLELFSDFADVLQMGEQAKRNGKTGSSDQRLEQGGELELSSKHPAFRYVE